MKKTIAAMNITIDGFCDHTAGVADAELHRHYADLLRGAGAVLYGRTTYQLMQYWQEVLRDPSAEADMDDFARAIDGVEKVVFSRTLSETGWSSAALATGSPREIVNRLRQQSGQDILVGSPSLIVQLANLDLIDEYQICVHPVAIGKGLSLFEGLTDRKIFSLSGTKQFDSGAIILYYSRL